MIETQQLELRARDAVSRCLIRSLAVPNVYFDVHWPTVRARRIIDVLAIDRAGVGDVHVVEIKYAARDAFAAIPALLKVPAQFRWIAFYEDTVGPQAIAAAMDKGVLYSPSGMGRVGVIQVASVGEHDLAANIIIRAERFAGSLRERVKKFTKQHPADVEFA